MNNPANITAADRLRTWAKEEIDRYRAEIRTGEPPFPQYAYDVLEVLDELAALSKSQPEVLQQ